MLKKCGTRIFEILYENKLHGWEKHLVNYFRNLPL